jgi:HSP20 family molecular chaperone IbpA
MNEKKDLVKRDDTALENSRRIPKVRPLVDIYESDDEILIHADMPGVTKEDIAINIDNGKLHLSGVRGLKAEGAANWVEFGDVEYLRSFSVPQTIDIEKVNAEFKDGVLRLHLPKSEAAKPSQIEIKAA